MNVAYSNCRYNEVAKLRNFANLRDPRLIVICEIDFYFVFSADFLSFQAQGHKAFKPKLAFREKMMEKYFANYNKALAHCKL